MTDKESIQKIKSEIENGMKRFYPVMAFILVFVSHAGYSVWKALSASHGCAPIENIPLWLAYFKEQIYFISFSYALTAAFIIYAVLNFSGNRKGSLAGVAGGISLAGIIYAGGCFLLGCCGSPMLAVYLGFFGSYFLGFTKPLIAVMTTVSVAIGYFWIKKKTKSAVSEKGVNFGY